MPRSIRASSGAVLGAAIDPEAYAGSAACWLMDEASGPLIDAVGGISVTADGTPFYNLAIGGIYAPGVILDGSSGFHIGTHQAAMDLGTGSLNLFAAVATASNTGTHTIIETTEPGTGNPGYNFRTVNESVQIQLLADDATAVNVSWSVAENTELSTLFNGSVHTLELRLNRTTHVANLYCDGTICTVQNEDISAVAGKNISGAGVGIGCDYRGVFASTWTGAICFIRQTNAVTYP